MDPVIETAQVCLCAVLGGFTVLVLLGMFWLLCRICRDVVHLLNDIDQMQLPR